MVLENLVLKTVVPNRYRLYFGIEVDELNKVTRLPALKYSCVYFFFFISAQKVVCCETEVFFYTIGFN